MKYKISLFALCFVLIYLFYFGIFQIKNNNIIKTEFLKNDVSLSSKFKDERRFFKKSIKNGNVIIKEVNILNTKEAKVENFINESKDDYILHVFDGEQNLNFIFYNPSDNFYPLNLLNLFSLLVIHGSTHNELSYDDKYKIIKSSPLILTCGPSSLFFNQLLKKQGIKSRIVSTLTLDEWNSYDNGHTLLEVFSEEINKWFLYDIDGQKVFKKDDILLDVVELQSYTINDIEIMSISNQANLDYSSAGNYFSFAENINSNPEDWYTRVFQKFSIFDEKTKKYVFLINHSVGEKKDIKLEEIQCNILKEYNENFECLEYNAFITRYYNDKN